MHFYFLLTTFIFNAISTLDLVRKRTLALEEGPIEESIQSQVYIPTYSQVFTKRAYSLNYFEEIFHPVELT